MAKKVHEAFGLNENDAQVIEGGDKIIDTAINQLQLVSGKEKADAAIAELGKMYMGLKVKDINDRPAYIAAKDGAKVVREFRLEVDRKRKELNEFPLKFQRAVNEEAKRITAGLTPIEEHCKAQVEAFEKAEEAAAQAEFKRRHELLLANGWEVLSGMYVAGPVHMSVDQVKKLTDSQLENAVKHGKGEQERKAAEAKRQQEQAAAQAAEADRLAKENAKLQQEKAALRAERLDIRSFKLSKVGVTLNEATGQFERRGITYMDTDQLADMSPLEFEAWLKEIGPDPGEPKSEPKPEPQTKEWGAVTHHTPVDNDTDPFGHASIEAAVQQIETTLNTDLADPFSASHSQEYVDGYEHCRAQVLSLFADPTPKKRAEFIKAVEGLAP